MIWTKPGTEYIPFASVDDPAGTSVLPALRRRRHLIWQGCRRLPSMQKTRFCITECGDSSAPTKYDAQTPIAFNSSLAWEEEVGTFQYQENP